MFTVKTDRVCTTLAFLTLQRVGVTQLHRGVNPDSDPKPGNNNNNKLMSSRLVKRSNHGASSLTQSWPGTAHVRTSASPTTRPRH